MSFYQSTGSFESVSGDGFSLFKNVLAGIEPKPRREAAVKIVKSLCKSGCDTVKPWLKIGSSGSVNISQVTLPILASSGIPRIFEVVRLDEGKTIPILRDSSPLDPVFQTLFRQV